MKKHNESNVTLIFLHGFLGSSAIWEPYVDYFSKKHSVLSVDLPGHGDSLCEGVPGSIKLLAKHIGELIQRLSLDNIIIIGHSLGGYVGGELVGIIPNKIKGLVLINSSFFSDSQQKKIERNKAIELVRVKPKLFTNFMVENLFLPQNLKCLAEEVSLYKKLSERIEKDTIISYLKIMRDRKATLNYVKQSALPTLFIAGKKDTVIDYNTVKNQVESGAYARLVTLNDSNHMGFWEEKETVTLAIESFLVSLNL